MGFCISKYFSSLALGSVASFYCYPLQVARFSIFQFILFFRPFEKDVLKSATDERVSSQAIMPRT